MNLFLPQILPIANPEQFKLHLACWNQEDQPLDVFVRDRSEWDNWNRWRGIRNDFNRDYIFSLIDFYPEKDRWIFGGAYRVLSRKPINNAASYQIELLPDSQPLIGRLKLEMKRPGRAKAVNFEGYYKNLMVVEVASTPYSGEVFPGYERIDIAFPTLETIVAIQRPDWKAALKNMKGVYLITDISNGKRYVGSAYGDTGIWARWACYVQTAHGYNDELTKVIAKHGKEYARTHFRFALLEHRPMKTDDNAIIERERYWKVILLTRGEFGYNRN
jgi:hypothetical protein